MQGLRKLIPALAMALVFMALPKSATAMSSATGPEPWGEFLFGDVGSFADACISDDGTIISCVGSAAGNSFFLKTPPWTFIGSGFLIVQDAFVIGDQFRVFDNDVAIGDTSAPIGSDTCGGNPVDCFADPNSSRGIFTLGAGDHSFTIQTLLIAPPFGSGAAYLCVSTSPDNCSPPSAPEPVPEPMSMLLLGLGLAGAFVWVQRPQLSKIRVVIAHKLKRR